jgi:hypothetical protein
MWPAGRSLGGEGLMAVAQLYAEYKLNKTFSLEFSDPLRSTQEEFHEKWNMEVSITLLKF